MGYMKNKQLEFRFSNMEMAFHCVFVGMNLMYIVWRIPSLAADNPNYPSEPSFLTPYVGLPRDNHDDQWQAYRANLPVLGALILGWKLLTHYVPLVSPRSSLLGLAVCLFSFRINCVLYFFGLTFWFFLTRWVGKNRLIVPGVWICMVVLLYVNQLYDHMRPISTFMDEHIPDALWWMRSSEAPIHWGHLLNMSLLKVISYTIDNYRGDEKAEREKYWEKCEECKAGRLTLKGRDLAPLPAPTYANYISYIIFAPTLLTGPPTPYKNYHSFEQYPTHTPPPYLYTIFLIFTLELFTHIFPVMPLQQEHTLIDVEVLSLFMLVFIWYKFLVIWRVARMWSLICGVDVVDNMGRCVFNNYGFEGFWRMWHRGFNVWLIRYLYVPLGGKQNILISVPVVVAFVAFWHDHSINIVVWAFIIVLFMLPELIIKDFFSKQYPHLFQTTWFKYLSAAVSALYIYIICLANLIGFGYGYEKSSIVLTKLITQWPSAIYSIIVITSAVIVMFYFRKVEKYSKNY